jgi:all-trans-8'-apo-beta-carotenal 15,15'-oxygenase
MSPGWVGGFSDLTREHGFEALRIEGTIPPELTGTLYRCGPGLMSCSGHRYRHPFDGDGAVTAVRVRGGSAWGATRLVQTPGLLAERRAGRPLYPAYGTLPPGPPARFPRPKNAANTAVMAWGSRLFALHEASPPTELDGEDLRTVGETDLGLDRVARGFAAHPHAVPARAALYNFGVRHGAETSLDLFELRAGAVRQLGAVRLAGATMVHDFAATERHLVFFAPPLRLRVSLFAAGAAPYGEALAWQPEQGTEVLVVPIDDPAAVVRFTVDPFFQWHFANAFERAGEILVDFIRYPDFQSNRWMAALAGGKGDAEVRRGTLARARIDPAARTLRLETGPDIAVEFPRVSPAVESHAHRYVYAASHSPAAAAGGPHDRIARVDTRTGAVVEAELGADQYASEPVFVPRGGAEEDGWLVALVYDGRRHASHLAILDATRLIDGPLARAWFDHHIPFTFHGIWR